MAKDYDLHRVTDFIQLLGDGRIIVTDAYGVQRYANDPYDHLSNDTATIVSTIRAALSTYPDWCAD